VNVALWVLQVLLALFFALASSAPKLFLPPEMLPPMPIPLPRAFVVFVGICEMLGAFGLIVPAVTKVRVGLVPLAAAGLTLVCIGGATYQIAAGEYGGTIFAVVLGLVCAFVAAGRWLLVPHRGKTEPQVLSFAR
jgi:hypothetical protein